MSQGGLVSGYVLSLSPVRSGFIFYLSTLPLAFSISFRRYAFQGHLLIFLSFVHCCCSITLLTLFLINRFLRFPLSSFCSYSSWFTVSTKFGLLISSILFWRTFCWYLSYYEKVPNFSCYRTLCITKRLFFLSSIIVAFCSLDFQSIRVCP